MRYRRGQALVMILLSAVVVASASVGPLYARALSHSVLYDTIAAADPSATRLTLDTSAAGDARPDVGEVTVPAGLSRYFRGGSTIWTTSLVAPDLRNSSVRLQLSALADGCAHLVLTSGRCPVAPDEALVSTEDTQSLELPVGAPLELEVATASNGATSQEPSLVPLRIVGVYSERPDPSYWFFTRLARPGTLSPKGALLTDSLVVHPSFFAMGAGGNPRQLDVRLTAQVPLVRDAMHVDDMAVVSAGLERLRLDLSSSTTTVDSGLVGILRDTETGLEQSARLVTLLLAQLALLSIAVLALAASAAVESRRPEMALARLRGRGRRGARDLVVRELLLLVALGAPLGLGVALGATELARHTWLSGGRLFEIPLAALVAAGLASLVSCVVVLAAAHPRAKEPISSLLRRVPPRHRGVVVGTIDIVVITLAVAGFLTIVNGDADGPVALATPVMLALAVGMSLALVVIPVARWVGRRALADGNVPRAMIALNVARRPAVRRVVAIGCVATALLCFAADAFLVAQRAREDRARAESGAEHVLLTDATNPYAFREAVRTLPAGSAAATAVVSTPTSNGLSTLVVDKDAFARVAHQVGAQPLDLAPLAAQRPVVPVVRGSHVALSVRNVKVALVEPTGRRPGVRLSIQVRGVDGQHGSILLPEVSDGTTATTLQGDAAICRPMCTVTGLRIDLRGGARALGGLELVSLTSEGGRPVDFSHSTWTPQGDPPPVGTIERKVPPADLDVWADVVALPATPPFAAASFLVGENGVTASIDSVPVPVLFAPPTGRRDAAAPQTFMGFDGVNVDLTAAADVGTLPGARDNAVLVDWDALTLATMSAAEPGTLQVWLAQGADVAAAKKALAARGITVTGERHRAVIQEHYDEAAAARSLRLTLVVGLLAVVLTILVLVLVAATSMRARARDVAGLRLAGVRASTLRRSVVGEQVAIVLIAAMVGVMCGFVGARLTLPMLPLFTKPSEVLVPDLSPAGTGVLLTGAASALAFVVTGVVLGRWMARRGDISLVKEQAQ